MARRSSRAVTLQDVAERAGVSPMTVSNVINRRSSVAPTLRDAVTAAIAELNYVPNQAARMLASAGLLRIGLLCPAVDNAFLGALLVGALHATTNLGGHLLLRQFDSSDVDGAERALAELVRDGANAIIVPPPTCERMSRSGFCETVDVPMVAISPGEALPNMASVGIDDFGAARELTEFLLSLGHRRIGFIRASETHLISYARRDGYLAALRDAGVAQEPGLIVDGQLTFDSGLMAAGALLDLRSPPTAIFASNDEMAIATISLAHRRGIDVPGALSVVGFDDSPAAARIWPALTTVRQPMAEICDLAVQYLSDRLRAPANPAAETIYAQHELVQRASTTAI